MQRVILLFLKLKIQHEKHGMTREEYWPWWWHAVGDDVWQIAALPLSAFYQNGLNTLFIMHLYKKKFNRSQITPRLW